MAVPSSLSCEHVCCMWLRRSLPAQLSWLDRNAPDVAPRAGAGTSKPSTTNPSKEDDEDVI
jgi:hypothetical protein